MKSHPTGYYFLSFMSMTPCFYFKEVNFFIYSEYVNGVPDIINNKFKQHIPYLRQPLR